MTDQAMSNAQGFKVWYNNRKRSSVVLLTLVLIFLLTSFLPSFIKNFPTLITYVFGFSKVNAFVPLKFTYFIRFSFIYLVSVGFTALIETNELEPYDNLTFLIFSLFMVLVVVVVSLIGFLFISATVPTNLIK
jgi:hypothetical protein